jgi:hypothetical protein
MTKREALEGQARLCDWLADNQGMLKGEWPEWKKYGNIRNNCFACEYHFNGHVKEVCILPIFENKTKKVGCNFECYKARSPLMKWSGHVVAYNKTNNRHITRYMRQIADSAREALGDYSDWK